MFNKQVVIITGGSSGIGKVLAEGLIRRGASPALIARDKKKLYSVKEELDAASSTGQRLEVFSCNVADALLVEKTMGAIADTLGPPDILINSAGIIKKNYFEKLSLDAFRDVMDINFFGTLHCIKAILPL